MKCLSAFFVLVLTVFTTAMAQGKPNNITPRLYASPSSSELRLGNTIDVAFVMEAAEEGRFTPPDWDDAGFDVKAGPAFNSSLVDYNGVSVAVVRYTYRVQPRDTGTLEIPATYYRTVSELFESEPVSIQVTRSDN